MRESAEESKESEEEIQGKYGRNCGKVRKKLRESVEKSEKSEGEIEVKCGTYRGKWWMK